MKYLFTLLVIVFPLITNAQKLNNNWEEELITALQEFKNCDNNITHGVNSCNQFIGQLLKTVYQLNDFYSETSGRYMLVSEMVNFLEESDEWSVLGHPYDQNVLNKAQELANGNKAVVAIYLNDEGIGNLSVILPGELTVSGTWNINVPNSASFFTFEPESSYVNKGLSYAFKRSQLAKVQLYARNY